MVSWIAVLGVLAGSTAGCSLSLSGPDPQASVRDTPRCDTGKGAVALDGVMGAVLAVPALAAFGGDEAELGVVLGLASVAYIAAAVRGSGVVDECRAAVEAHDLSVDQPVRDQPARDRPADEDEDAVRSRRRAILAARREVARPSAAEPAEPADPTAAPAPPPTRAPAPAPAPVAAPAPAPAEPAAVEPWREFWKEIR